MKSFERLLILLENKKKEELNDEDQKKVDFLEKMLKNKAYFFRIQADTAYNILSFLGIPKEELKEVYLDLTSPEMFQETVPKVRILPR